MERPISAGAVTRAALVDVCRVLADDPAAALAPSTVGAARRAGTLRAGLAVELPGGASVAQDVVLELGPLEQQRGEAMLPVSWHAVSRHRPVPTFRGLLHVRAREGDDAADTELVLNGFYHPPLRALGAFADGLVAHRFARASVQRFMEAVAANVDAEVDRRRASTGVSPAPAPEHLNAPATA